MGCLHLLGEEGRGGERRGEEGRGGERRGKEGRGGEGKVINTVK